MSMVEVRDSPHGICGSCTRYPRGLTRWAELLGRRGHRRRRRQLVLPGGYRPSDPPPCLISKEQVCPNGLGAQAFQSHGLEMGRKSTGSNPAVFPDSQVIPECLVLQYSQIHRSYQNAWSFSISRFTGHTRMLGPSVFPDSRVLRMLGPLMPKV